MGGQFIATSKLDSFALLPLAASSLASTSSRVWDALASVQVTGGTVNSTVKECRNGLAGLLTGHVSTVPRNERGTLSIAPPRKKIRIWM